MTLYAVLADIHGNLPALEAVEKDVDEQRKKGEDVCYVCLGDIVDYGPQPNECVEWIIKKKCRCVQGNHDSDVAAPFNERPLRVKALYWPFTLWTRKTVDAGYKKHLSSLPPVLESLEDLPGVTLFHGSLAFNKPDTHIHVSDDSGATFEALKSRVGLFGHTHEQGWLIHSFTGIELCLATDERMKTGSLLKQVWRPVPLQQWHTISPKANKMMINPGSVGQPRWHDHLKESNIQHDARAAYMLMRYGSNGHSGELEFQFRRVKYDPRPVIALLKKASWQPDDPGLDEAYNHLRAHTMYYTNESRPGSNTETAEKLTQATQATVLNHLVPTLEGG